MYLDNVGHKVGQLFVHLDLLRAVLGKIGKSWDAGAEA
jgi:hypothetical protein